MSPHAARRALRAASTALRRSGTGLAPSTSSRRMSTGSADSSCPVGAAYDRLVSSGEWRPDPAQASAVRELSALRASLITHRRALRGFFERLDAHEARRAELEAEVAQREKDVAASSSARTDESLRAARRALSALPPPPTVPRPPRGLYLWGGVGVGKTRLMDAFFASLDDSVVRHKRRVHFNEAMLELHEKVHRHEARDAARLSRLREGKATDDEVASELEPDATKSAGLGGFLNPAAYARSILAAVRRRRRLSVKRRLSVDGSRRRVAPDATSSHSNDDDDHDDAESFANDGGDTSVAPYENASVLRRAARDMLGDARTRDGGFAVLCFDEFHVADAFTAVALKGLLEELLSLGAVVVATSNRSIDALDASGAGAARDVFEAFAATLRDRAKEVEVRGETDHRRLEYDARRRESNDGGILRHSNDDSNYFYPSADASTRARFETKRRAWFPNESDAESNASDYASATLPVAFGRRLIVPRVSPCGGAAHFTFDELCGRPLGTADYCALTKAFGVVFVEDVPRMSRATRDKARRFISLIDEAYNRNATLIFLAASHPDALFSGKSDGVVSSSDAVFDGALDGGDGGGLDLESLQFETEAENAGLRRDVRARGGVAPVAGTAREMRLAKLRLSGLEERFAFSRATSRVLEMQTPKYASRARRER
jgi:predicted ATPase